MVILKPKGPIHFAGSKRNLSKTNPFCRLKTLAGVASKLKAWGQFPKNYGYLTLEEEGHGDSRNRKLEGLALLLSKQQKRFPLGLKSQDVNQKGGSTLALVWFKGEQDPFFESLPVGSLPAKCP